MTEIKTVWVIMVVHPATGEWRRVGNAYHQHDVAKSWVSFVKAYWHGARTRVRTLRIRLKDGRITDAWKRKLSEVYNFDVND